MREFLKSIALSGVGLLMSVQAASAMTIGYDVVINGSFNVPTVTLSNTGDTGEITDFSITIGNTAYNFDAVQNITSSTGVTPVLVQGDTANSGYRHDDLIFSFTGFSTMKYVAFDTDVDFDPINTSEDYRSVLFNNGSNPNSVLTVGFSTGHILSQITGDLGGLTEFRFSQEKVLSVVPLPAALPLYGAGIAVLGFMGWRRRKAA